MLIKSAVYFSTLIGCVSTSPASDKFQKKRDEICKISGKNALTMDELHTQHERVKAWAGANYPFEAVKKIKKSKSTDDNINAVIEVVKDPKAVGESVGKSSGIVIAFLLFFFWIFPCWFCCCCRCCRRCRCLRCCGCGGRNERKNMGFITRNVLLLVYVALCLSALVVSWIAYSTSISATNDIDAMACVGLDFTTTILNGAKNSYEPDNSSKSFYGINNVIVTAETLVNEIDENSSFINSVRATLLETRELEKASKVLEGHMKALQASFEDPTTMEPEDSNHECIICKTSDILNAASSKIASGTAGALNGMRKVVNAELAGSKLATVKKNLQDVLKNQMSSIRDNLEDQIDSYFYGNIDQAREFGKYIKYVVLGVSVLILFPMVIGIIGMLCIMLRKTADSLPTPFFNGCSWCGLCLFAMLILLFTGIFGAIAYALSCGCVTIADPAKSIRDVKGAFEDDTTVRMLRSTNDPFGIGRVIRGRMLSANPASMYNNLERTIDTCLTSTGNGEILDSFYMDSTTTARDKVNFQKTIDAEFDKLGAGATAANIPKLAPSPEFVKLAGDSGVISKIGSIYIMKQATIQSLIQSAIAADPTHADDATLLVKIAAQAVPEVSSSCNQGPIVNMNEFIPNYPARDQFNTLAVNEFPSLQYMFTKLGSKTTIDCTSLYGSYIDNSDTDIWKDVIYMKQKVIKKMNYKCYTSTVVYTDSTGTACTENGSDFNAVKDCSYKYQNSIPSISNCNFADFKAYLGTMKTNIKQAAEALDDVITGTGAQAGVFDKIMNGIKHAVKVKVTDVIQDVVNKLTCSFMYQQYTNFINHFCWSMTANIVTLNFLWLALGVLAIVSMIVQWIMWRHLKDNQDVPRD